MTRKKLKKTAARRQDVEGVEQEAGSPVKRRQQQVKGLSHSGRPRLQGGCSGVCGTAPCTHAQHPARAAPYALTRMRIPAEPAAARDEIEATTSPRARARARTAQHVVQVSAVQKISKSKMPSIQHAAAACMQSMRRNSPAAQDVARDGGG